MVQKASRLPTKTDLMLNHELKIKEILGLLRKRVTIQQSGLFGGTPMQGATNSASGPGGTGDFLRKAGDQMKGPIAFDPVNTARDTTLNFINISPNAANPPDYSTFVSMSISGDLQFIDGAAWSGQYLILQAINQFIFTVKSATIRFISNIVGDGATQIITVTTTLDHGFSVGEVIEVDETTNFNQRASIIAVPTATTFTYDLGSVGSATPETSGVSKNGNILSGSGNDLILDATIDDFNSPIITLVFDVLVAGGGVWRVTGITGTGAGANEFPDNLFRIFDEFDPTAKLSFNVDGVFTGNTVTWFVPNASGIVCLLDSGFTQLFEDGIEFIGASPGLDMNGRLITLDVDGDSNLGVIFTNTFTMNLGGSLEYLVQTSPPRVDVFFKKVENVLDPILDLDAVNFRTLNNKIAEVVAIFHNTIMLTEGIFEFSQIDPALNPTASSTNTIFESVSVFELLVSAVETIIVTGAFTEPNVKRVNPVPITETVGINVVTP